VCVLRRWYGGEPTTATATTLPTIVASFNDVTIIVEEAGVRDA
jgi:hypothetical protein